MLINFDYLFKAYKIRSEFVLHLGANEGQEALTYQQHGVKRCIWVEAIPDVYKKLKEHVSRYPGHVAYQACLSNRSGIEVKSNITSNQAQSSSFLEFGTHAHEHPTVRVVKTIQMFTVRLDDLFNFHSVDVPEGGFLNIDLQGAELLALEGMGDMLKKFQHVYVEVNEKELYKGCPLVAEIDAYLANFGFVPREVKMTGSGWGDKYYSK